MSLRHREVADVGLTGCGTSQGSPLASSFLQQPRGPGLRTPSLCRMAAAHCLSLKWTPSCPSGATKLQLAEYYLAVGEWLTPQLAKRPLSIVRAPEGVSGDSFFQRHCGRLKMPHMRVLDKSLDPEHARLIQADSVTAVIEAVQMGTIEFHTWNARSDRIDKPDRVVFDLDPDPELEMSSR